MIERVRKIVIVAEIAGPIRKFAEYGT